MVGQRVALIVAVDAYSDPSLRQLAAPTADAQALAEALSDPELGAFDVQVVTNEPSYAIREAIETFFVHRRADDLALLHFSCHGIKDDSGELFLASTDTRPQLLGSTAIDAAFVGRQMRRSRARRAVLLLDCCYGGAFERGMVPRASGAVDVGGQFGQHDLGGGRGRAIITASSAMEYAFEDAQLLGEPDARPSLFTSALVEGVTSGDADRNHDGRVSLGELYEFVYDRVRERTSNQTPSKWEFGFEGDLMIARNPQLRIAPAPLPPELLDVIAHPLTASRFGGVHELRLIASSDNLPLAAGAREALQRMTEDDSRRVSTAAAEALEHTRLRVSTTEVDVGELRVGDPRPIIEVDIDGPPLAASSHVTSSSATVDARRVDRTVYVSVDTADAREVLGTVTISGPAGGAEITVHGTVRVSSSRSDPESVAPDTSTRQPESESTASPGSEHLEGPPATDEPADATRSQKSGRARAASASSDHADRPEQAGDGARPTAPRPSSPGPEPEEARKNPYSGMAADATVAPPDQDPPPDKGAEAPRGPDSGVATDVADPPLSAGKATPQDHGRSRSRSFAATAIILVVVALVSIGIGQVLGGGDSADRTADEVAPRDGDGQESGGAAGDDSGDSDAGETGAPGANDGTLTTGTVLPETGNLAFLGPAEFAAAELAVQDINEAGGVLGNDVELLQGDSGDTTTDIANQTVDRHIERGADVIVGAASSAVSFTIIDKVTNAGLVHFSPANTAPQFTTYDDNGLYFRTAPSDVLQGRVLGELMIEDGCVSVGVMALQDDPRPDRYGEELFNNVGETFRSSGGEITDEIVYDPQASNFDSEVQQIASKDPDCAVIIGFQESALILSAMSEQGLWPPTTNIYLVDGNIGNATGKEVDASMAGIKGTLPGSVASDRFTDRLLDIDPELTVFLYAGETYDAIVVSALAAEVAGSDDGTVLATEIPDVTRRGTTCKTFRKCKQLIADGEDIDYDGQSGPIELDDAGDPQRAEFQILVYDNKNRVSVDTSRSVSM